MPEGFTLRDRLRTALAGSPISTDRIGFTVFVYTDERRYGLAVLVPLLSTPCFHDAVTVRYRTILHRTKRTFTASTKHPLGRTSAACPKPQRLRRRPGYGKFLECVSALFRVCVLGFLVRFEKRP